MLSASTLAIVVLAIVPLLLLSSTSFVKLSIVFSMLRNALGTGDVPSGAVVNVLALILSLFLMAPVARAMLRESAPYAAHIDWQAPLVGESGKAVWQALDHGKEPLRVFLTHNAGNAESKFFVDIARRSASETDRATLTDQSMVVALPAFFITELKEAFEIAFLLLLPFLILDLVIASILTSLGMQTLSPVLVALPFKLLLFVSIDGFRTLIEALLAGYTT